jgi:uncharacterized protein (TIGR02145 family)
MENKNAAQKCNIIHNNIVLHWLNRTSSTVCPTGWHVLTDAEWTTLTDYLINNGYGYKDRASEITKSMAAT